MSGPRAADEHASEVAPSGSADVRPAVATIGCPCGSLHALGTTASQATITCDSGSCTPWGAASARPRSGRRMRDGR